MSSTQVYGLIFAVIGVGTLVYALFVQRRLGAMRGTRTLNIADLTAQPPGGGVTCEIKGQAEPGPAGRLQGPYSGQACVWFATKVEERWIEHSSHNGRSHRRRRSRTVEEKTSAPYFQVRDATGVAVLDLRGTKIDAPKQTHHRVVPVGQGGFKEFAIEFLRNKHDQELVYSEIIVPPGQPIYALGKGGPHPQTGAPMLTEPDSGPFIVSTRSEEQLTQRTNVRMIASYVLGGLLFAGGGITTAAAALF